MLIVTKNNFRQDDAFAYKPSSKYVTPPIRNNSKVSGWEDQHSPSSVAVPVDVLDSNHTKAENRGTANTNVAMYVGLTIAVCVAVLVVVVIGNSKLKKKQKVKNRRFES